MYIIQVDVCWNILLLCVNLVTTNPAAFINKYGKPERIRNSVGESIVPSLILFVDDQTYVGTFAMKSF